MSCIQRLLQSAPRSSAQFASDHPSSDAARRPATQGVGETASTFTARARPAFLYVMYAMILWSIPIGLIAGVSPSTAGQIADGMTRYLAALPEPLYALFGTGYLGYATLRQWGKVKALDR